MTTLPSELIVGRTYFSLAYEDEKLTRLYIHSLEYKGINKDLSADEPKYVFQFIGAATNDDGDIATPDASEWTEGGDQLVIVERQLDMILSFEELASELVRLAPTNGAWTYNDK